MRASLPYPTVKDYLEWVRKRITVTFRRLEHPKVPPRPQGFGSSTLRAHRACLVPVCALPFKALSAQYAVGACCEGLLPSLRD